MPKRLSYHFEPQKGWINDPNGLIYFKGKYHAFFQHNPYEPKWGPMHWGHAVSDDLIHWQELEIALYPDMPYENSDGCFSGSAIEKDGRLFLFYTSVSHEWKQTQSMAVSEDGIHFVKYENNPLLPEPPVDGSADFRDPKVTKINDIYYMVVGSGKDGVGKILLYKSLDLFRWAYAGVLFQSTEFGGMLECPNFFSLDGQYVLMFSKMGLKTHSTQFVVGTFENEIFTPVSFQCPEAGPQFYAPQTFLDPDGKRIMIGWLYDWCKPLDEGADYAGALSIPRELRLENGILYNFPVSNAIPLLRQSDELVEISDHSVVIRNDSSLDLKFSGCVHSVDILRDTKTIEVFINRGSASFSYWFAK